MTRWAQLFVFILKLSLPFKWIVNSPIYGVPHERRHQRTLQEYKEHLFCFQNEHLTVCKSACSVLTHCHISLRSLHGWSRPWMYNGISRINMLLSLWGNNGWLLFSLDGFVKPLKVSKILQIRKWTVEQDIFNGKLCLICSLSSFFRCINQFRQ